MVVPFLRDFFPAGMTWKLADGGEPASLPGLIPTRTMVNLLLAIEHGREPPPRVRVIELVPASGGAGYRRI